jgi:hypothetical protein
MVWRRFSTWQVAAYYPSEGYGGVSSFGTYAEAMAHREYLMTRGGYKRVHVRELISQPVDETTQEPAAGKGER